MGAARSPPPLGAWVSPGRSGGVGGWGAGVALPQLVPLPPLYGNQGGLRYPRSFHGAGGFHTAPAHVGALLPGRSPRGAPWGVLVYRRVDGEKASRLAGAVACRGHCGSGQATVRGRAARGSSGVPSAALGLGRCKAVVLLSGGHLRGEGGRGGGIPGLPGGYRAGVPRPVTSSPRAAGGGGERVAPGYRSPSALYSPPGRFLGCGGSLEGLGPGPVTHGPDAAPTTVGFFCVSRG